MLTRRVAITFFFLVLCALSQGAGMKSVPVSFVNGLDTAVTVEIDGTPTCELDGRMSSVLPECVVRLSYGEHNLKVITSQGGTLTEPLSLPPNSSRCYRRIVEKDGAVRTIAACDLNEAPKH